MIKNQKFADAVQWCARVIGVLIIVLFLVFGIGEGLPGDGGWMPASEWTMFIFIPAMVAAGIIAAWWKPVLGGYLIIAGVVLFNLVDMIAFSGDQFLNLDFGWLAILGMLFIISSQVKPVAKKQQKIRSKKQ